MDVMRVWPEKEPAKQVPVACEGEWMPLGFRGYHTGPHTQVIALKHTLYSNFVFHIYILRYFPTPNQFMSSSHCRHFIHVFHLPGSGRVVLNGVLGNPGPADFVAMRPPWPWYQRCQLQSEHQQMAGVCCYWGFGP